MDYGLPRGPLQAYLSVRDANRRAGIEDTQNSVGLLRILAGIKEQQQAAQNDAALKSALAETGGDPQAAVGALLRAGNVRGAASLAPLLKQQGEGGFTLGDTRYDASGRVIATAPPKPAAPYTLTPGAQRRGPNDEILAEAPPRPAGPGSEPEIIKLTNYLNQLAPNDPTRRAVEARIKQITTHQPGVNVYSTNLTAGVDAQGNPIFIQPSGRADTPPRAVEGVFPPERADAAKARKEAEQAGSLAASVRERIQKMGQLIQGGSMTGGVVGPQGAVGRIAETARGVVQPNAPTPSLDYENEKTLLLSDVRKLVEKDPNLSNEERQTLYRALGGGMLQTPGSALRTLNNVMSKIENAAVTGKSREARQEQAPQDPAQRVKDRVYQTPRGPMKWTGTGWLPQ